MKFEEFHKSGKYYKNGLGEKIKIYAIHDDDVQCVDMHGAVLQRGQWHIETWTRDGIPCNEITGAVMPKEWRDRDEETIVGEWEEDKSQANYASSGLYFKVGDKICNKRDASEEYEIIGTNSTFYSIQCLDTEVCSKMSAREVHNWYELRKEKSTVPEPSQEVSLVSTNRWKDIYLGKEWAVDSAVVLGHFFNGKIGSMKIVKDKDFQSGYALDFGPKCECGKDKHGFAFHSHWCPKWEKV